jgi:hypothetical protein
MPLLTVSYQLWRDRRRRTEVLLALAGCVCCALLTWRTAVPSAEIIKNAVCSSDKSLDCNAGSLSGLATAAQHLISPALVALIAICPIACLVGAAAVMFGNRRGLIIIGSALGALVFAGAISGIVA